jgi:hypothetical protein
LIFIDLKDFGDIAQELYDISNGDKIDSEAYACLQYYDDIEQGNSYHFSWHSKLPDYQKVNNAIALITPGMDESECFQIILSMVNQSEQLIMNN